MTNNSNIITRYDDMLYENRPVSLNEFLSNKLNNVHDELYNSALNKYIKLLSTDIVFFFALIKHIVSFFNVRM